MRPVRANELPKYGKILKINNFDTPEGFYTIRIISYNNQLLFHKMKNGVTVECINLTELEEKTC